MGRTWFTETLPIGPAAIWSIGIALFLWYPLFLQPYLLFGGDTYFPYAQAYQFQRGHFLSMWNGYVGADNLGLLPQFLQYEILTLFGNPELIQRVMFLSTFFLIPFFVFVAAYETFQSAFPTRRDALIGAFTASFVAVFNPEVVIRTPQLWILWGYAFIPVVYIILRRLLRDVNHEASLTLVVVLGIALSQTLVSPSFFVISISFVLLGTACFVILNLTRKTKKSRLALRVLYVVAAIPLSVVFGFYLILPLFFGYADVSSPNTITIETIQLLSDRSTFVNVIGLRGNWWPTTVFNLPFPASLAFAAASMSLPLIAYSALPLTHKNRDVWVLTAVAVFVTVLAMGMNSPLGFIWGYALFSASPFSTFAWLLRDPDKWSLVLAFCYSILWGFSLPRIARWLLKKLTNVWKHFKPHLTKSPAKSDPSGAIILIVLCLLALPATSAHPFLNGNLGGQLNFAEVPADYRNLDRWLSEIPGDFRVLYIPFSPAWGGARPIASFESTPEAGRFLAFTLGMVKRNETNSVGKYLALANVKYVVFDAASSAALSSITQNMITSQTDLRFLREFGASLYVYQNLDYNGLIHSSDVLSLAYGSLDSLRWFQEYGVFPLSQPIVFAESSGNSRQALELSDNVLLIDRNLQDLVLSSIPSQYVIPLMEPMLGVPGWGKLLVTSSEWYNYWQPSRYDFDYGSGFIFTPRGFLNTTNLTASIAVELLPDGGKGPFSAFARVWEGPSSGHIETKVDGNIAAIVNGSSPVTRGFAWVSLGSLNLSSGRHVFDFTNLDGFNAINVLAVVPSAVYNATEALVKSKVGRPEGGFLQLVSASSFKVIGGSVSDYPVPRITLDRPAPAYVDPLELGNASAGAWTFSVWNSTVDAISGQWNNTGVWGNYSFAPGKGSAAYVSWNSLRPINWTNYDTIIVTVQSDGSGNELQVWMRDAALNGSVGIYATPLNWTGLKTVRIPIPISSVANVATVLFTIAYTDTANGSGNHSFAFSNVTLRMVNGSRAESYIYVPENGTYQVTLRGSSNPNARVVVLLDGQEAFKFNSSNPTSSAFLSSGEHPIAVVADRPLQFASVTLRTVNGIQLLVEALSYQKASDTQYTVRLFSSAKVLQFLEPYHPSWLAEAGGKPMLHWLANGFSNAFVTLTTVNGTIEVSFKPQDAYETGVAVSAGLYVAASIVIMAVWVRQKVGRLPQWSRKVRPELRLFSQRAPRTKTTGFRAGLPFSLVFLMGCTRIGLEAMRFERTVVRLSKWTTMGLLPDRHSILLRPFSDDPIVVNEIHNWRSYETSLIMHPGDVVIDIGAHIGVFTLRASRAVGPSGRVIAVEPEAHNFELLARNCRLNRLGNVLLRNTAAGASTGQGRLRVYKSGRTTTHSLESPLTRDQPLANPDFTTADVHCETVDSIVFSSQLQKVDAIKIDVEEHEIDVLEGAREVLRVFKPRMVIEVASENQGIVTRWLAGHDYRTEANPKVAWIVYATPRTMRSGASSF